MTEDPGDEGLAHLGQPVGGPCLVEGVDIALEQREMEVHAGPVVILERLRHESGVYAMLEGDLLHGQPGGHDRVGHGQRIGVAGDDLVLAGSDLVMRVLDGDAHLLESVDRVPPVVLGDVEGGQVEVPAAVQHLGLGPGVPEVEELELGGCVEGVPHLGGAGQVALEHSARVAGERLAVGGGDVAEHAGHLLLGAPGQDAESGRVRSRQHVCFLDPGIAVDSGAVEGHSLLECHLQLGRADRHRLEEPLDIGEPEPDESDPALFDGTEHVLGLFVHLRPLIA